MRWPLNNRTRVLLLAILAVVVVAQSLTFYLREVPIGSSPAQSEMDFLLEVYGEPGGVEFAGSASPTLPLFDPTSESWTIDGQPVSDFASYIQGLEVGPHGSSPFVVVAIPDNGSVSDYRRALASLSSQGICRVGVFSPLSNGEFVSLRADGGQPPEVFVPVYRVLKVKRDGGTAKVCKDRFPPFAPCAS